MAKKAVNVSISGEYNDKDILRAIKDLEALQKQSQSTARKMQDVGKKMSMALTAPLVGIGVAAAKSAMDFDDAMTKITSLVGIGAQEVDGMRQEVLGLAGETAKAPNELADALFVVTSAGLRGQEAMSALESASKASAAGLGNTADIARSVAGAVNTYGTEVLNASKATDIIVATARAGNFETSQFAAALGNVLPFASAAEASLEDVGGAVALLTRTNGDASKSITSVTALLRAVATPTKQTQTQLQKLGLTTGDVRDVMGEQGLVEAVRLLDKRLGGNRDQLQQVLGSSEAVAAAMQILDADTEALAGTFGTVSEATGLTDEAFDAASQTAGFQFRQALQNLQATLIKFGDELAPAVSTLSNGISAVASAFGAMPGPMKTFVVALGAVVAAIGPILFLGGKLLILKSTLGLRAQQMSARMTTAFMTARTGFQTMTATMRLEMIKAQTQMGAMAAGARVMAATMVGAFRTVVVAARTLLGALGPIGVAIGLLSIGFSTMQDRIQETKKFVDDFRGSLDQTTGALTEMSAAMVTKNFRLNLDEGDINNLRDMGIGVNDLTEAVLEGPDAVEALDDRLSELSKGFNILAGPGRSLAKSRDLLKRFSDASLDAGDSVRVARDDAFAAARGFDASGSSAQESVYGYNSATGSLELLAGGYDVAGDAALDFAGDVAQSAAIGAQAATAIGVAMGQVPEQALNAINKPWYFEMLDRIKEVGEETGRTFGGGGATDRAFDAFEERVTEATRIAGEKMDEVVKGYYDTWQNAYKEAVQFGNDLAAGITGQLSFSSAVDAATEGGGSIVDAITGQASKVGDFNQQLIDLLGTGLSEEAFQMVAEMGAERGSQLAKELLGANGAQMIADINKVVADAEYVADQMGKLAAEKWRGAGVRSAQKTYEGIRDNFKRGKGPAWKAVMNTMDRLAKDSAREARLDVLITRRVNEEVTRVVEEIRVPAPVVAARQPQYGGAAGAIVTRPTFSLIGEAGPEALIPLDQAPGASPVGGLGGGIVVNVNAGMGTDGAEVGRQIVEALSAYERRNGKVYANA